MKTKNKIEKMVNDNLEKAQLKQEAELLNSSIISKRFKIEFLMDGNLEQLHTAYLDGKNKNDVIKRFNILDLESRRDIISINVC